MLKIYSEKRGIVLTNDQKTIDEILAEGGRVIKKNSEIEQGFDDLVDLPVVEKPEICEDVPVVKTITKKRK